MSVYFIRPSVIDDYVVLKNRYKFRKLYFRVLRCPLIASIILAIVLSLLGGLRALIDVCVAFAIIAVALMPTIYYVVISGHDYGGYKFNRVYYHKKQFFGDKEATSWAEVVVLDEKHLAVVYKGDLDGSFRYPEAYSVWIVPDADRSVLRQKLRSFRSMSKFVNAFGSPSFCMLFSEKEEDNFAGLSSLCGALEPDFMPSDFTVQQEAYKLMLDCSRLFVCTDFSSKQDWEISYLLEKARVKSESN